MKDGLTCEMRVSKSSSHNAAVFAGDVVHLEHGQQREDSTGIEELALSAVVARDAVPHAVNDGQQKGLDSHGISG